MSALLSSEMSVYPMKIWLQDRDHYERIASDLVTPLTREARHGQPHLVYDFLFDYYSFRPNQLKRWSPGFGHFLEGATKAEMPGLTHFNVSGGYIDAGAFPEKRREGLDWVISLLQAMENRPALHACYGLHEWAMVYESDQPRYTVPLRFSKSEIKEIVERQPIGCTHYDAFRFFTKRAAPLNRIQLNKENRMKHDQPGCIHANMDLYKWAYKFYPWMPSQLILEAFELALKARVLDMRASPYDLDAWGFSPVCIETPAGRDEYEKAQRELARCCVPVRERLLTKLGEFRDAVMRRAVRP